MLHLAAERVVRALAVTIALAMIMTSPATGAAQGVVERVDGGTVTLSVGTSAGVEVGMTGRIVENHNLMGVSKNRLVATFEVVAVEETTCTVVITKLEKGRDVEWHQQAAFDQPLSGLSPPQEGRAATPHSTRPARGGMAMAGSDPSRAPALAAPSQEHLKRTRAEARRYLDAGNWFAAAEHLRILATADRKDPLLQKAIAGKRAEAQQALDSNDPAGAVAACNAALLVVEDAATRVLLERASARLVEARLEPILLAANAVVGELTEIERRPFGDPLPADDLRRLFERRLDVLRDLLEARREAEAQQQWRLTEMVRAVSAGGKIPVAGGEVLVGCTPGDRICQNDEKPAHVRRVEPLLLDATEVTIGQYRAFVAVTGYRQPSSVGFDQSSRHPVVNVSWNDAVQYCAWTGGRLPNEAEWEMAARAGSFESLYPWGSSSLERLANIEGIEGADQWRNTSPVAAFEPNPWGFFDLAGNAWEWCEDHYSHDYHAGTPDIDQAALLERLRVLRGGSWLGDESYLRVSSRSWYPASRHMFNIGFRCARRLGAR